MCRGEGKSRDESLIRTLAYLCDSVDHVRWASVPMYLVNCRASIPEGIFERTAMPLSTAAMRCV